MSEFESGRTAAEIRALGFGGARNKNFLSPGEQDPWRELSTLVAYDHSGFEIFAEGEDAHFIYAIGEGAVRIVRYVDNGQRQILAFMMPGDLFGLPDNGTYANTAETISAVRLYRLPWHNLIQRMMDDPQLQLNLLVRVADDLHRAQRRIMMLGQQTTSQRLATLLLEFVGHPEFYNDRDGHLHLPITRVDVADYLGIARETAARAITRFERERLLRRIDPKTIQILDIAGLRDAELLRPKRGN